MTRVRQLQIENFRGIKSLCWDPEPGINCIIGQGDSGKSSILDAIDLCLGARRSVQFSDVDFFNLDVTQPISITVVLGALPDQLKAYDTYGLFLRAYDNLIGTVSDEPKAGEEIVLSLNLTVSADLEPVWTLVSQRAATQGITRGLSWKDRQLISPTRIGATAGQHLSWQRGAVLNRISDERSDASAALVSAARNARAAFGDQADQQLRQALNIVTTTAQELGVHIGNGARAMLDMHSVSFSGGTIALHDQAGVPLHGLGIGSTRLLIAGLERKAAGGGGIVLADEVEYGLEPHRLARFLDSLGAKERNSPPLQVFMTTHSPVALRELAGDQLYVLRVNHGQHRLIRVGTRDDKQSAIRAYPEAFLAKSIIACEGASEVGLIRGLDQYWVECGSISISARNCALFDCGGRTPEEPYKRASVFQRLGYRCMVLRDDDKPPQTEVDKAFVDAGGYVIAWQAGRALEDELFGSLAVGTCQALLTYAVELHADLVDEHLKSASNGACNLAVVLAEMRTNHLQQQTRIWLGKAARTRNAGWFKSISWMEHAARTIIGPGLQYADKTFYDRITAFYQWVSAQ